MKRALALAGMLVALAFVGLVSIGRLPGDPPAPPVPRSAAPPDPGGERRSLPPPDLTRPPADGRRRVALLLVGSGDWEIVRTLRARGELPVLDGLLASGHHAVLESDPPLPGAALEALLRPGRSAVASPVDAFHRFGAELAELGPIDANPLGALRWLLPEDEDLLDTIGAGNRSALAMGFVPETRGGPLTGEVVGPDGFRRPAPSAPARRRLDADERRRFRALATRADPASAERLAAELDAAGHSFGEREHALVMARVRAITGLSHAVLRREPGAGDALHDAYRYFDARLAGLARALDADDVLLLLSDRGLDTSPARASTAFFLAAGGGVPAGRAAGRPALGGVGRVVADLLGIAAEWPDTGIAAWASARRFAEAPPAR